MIIVVEKFQLKRKPKKEEKVKDAKEKNSKANEKYKLKKKHSQSKP